MPLVPALCTQCGAKLEIDSSQEAAVCPYCHTPFVTEEAITNYNTTNVTNIGNLHADIVNVTDSQSLENLIKSAETFMKMKNYASADDLFTKIHKEFPYDARGWSGSIRAYTENFKKKNINLHQIDVIELLYDSFRVVANEQEKTEMNSKYIPYITEVKEKINAQKLNIEQQIDQLNKNYEKEANSLQNLIKDIEKEMNEKENHTTTVSVVTVIVVIVLSSIDGILHDAFRYFILGCLIFGVPALIIRSVICDKLKKAYYESRRNMRQCIDEKNTKLSQITRERDDELIRLQEILIYDIGVEASEVEQKYQPQRKPGTIVLPKVSY